MQAYSNPKRASDPYSLPDVEIWQSDNYEADCPRCGIHSVPEYAEPPEPFCPSCGRSENVTISKQPGASWWWWTCFPGCLPDSDPFGPFDTEEEALADAQEDA